MSDALTLLLIEDSPLYIKLLHKIIQQGPTTSYTIKSVETLQDAFRVLSKNKIDVILLDLSLPDSNGLDTFTKVNEKAAHLPIVILSGLDDEQVALKTVQLGAQDYLVKGQFNGRYLNRILHYAIERKRIQETLRASEERLRHFALHDPLTELPNRTNFLRQLEMAVERAKQSEGYLLALLFIDLDYFKEINDSFGHHYGDELLKTVAERLLASIRASDVVARLGGDEFVILLDNIEDVQIAHEVAKRIQANLQSPVRLFDKIVEISASIGVTLNTRHYERAKDLLKDADIAMYHVKMSGKANYSLYHTGLLLDNPDTPWSKELDDLLEPETPLELDDSIE
ncbi:diguanylate cyclase domain-containing protein [Candidatus Leptofilum sp.]|uniref:two-component system response regulator n=1 Tax=Candidatus Leptofilum sp. TaxID=3241576 RepID=UPI003B5BBE3A